MTYEEALAVLRIEEAERRRRTRAFRICAGALALLTVAFAVWMLARGKYRADDALMTFAPLAAFVGVAYGFTPRQKSALLAAAESGDSRLVGHLCEALGSGDAELSAAARRSLAQILPTLKPEGARLDSVQHDSLSMALRGSDEAFAAAAIRALPAIGRPESIPLLEALATSGSPLRREAAQTALPKLRAELAREAVMREVAAADEGRRRLELRLAATPDPLHEHQTVSERIGGRPDPRP